MESAVTNHSTKRIQFGTFEADLQAGELRRSGIRVHLQSQPFRLLAILAEHPGEVVSRETLQLELWGSDTNVNFDHCLGIAVNKLRDALGDSAENPRFVETLAKRGYRFIAPVRILDTQAIATAVEESPVTVEESPAAPSRPPETFWPWLAAGLAIVCLILSALIFLRSPARTSYRPAQAGGRQQDLWVDSSGLIFVRAADLLEGCGAGHGERFLFGVNDADQPRALSFSVQHTALEGCTIFHLELGSGTAQMNGTQLTLDIPAKQAVMFRTE